MELCWRVGFLLLQLFPSGGATDTLCDCSAQQLGQQLHGAVVTAQCRTDTAVTSCCSGGGPRQPRSSGLPPVSRFHSSIPLFPLVPAPNRPIASVDVKQQSWSVSASEVSTGICTFVALNEVTL